MVLMDNFRGRSDKRMTERTLAIDNVFPLEIMASRIIPKAQPLDVLLNKTFKAFFHDLVEKFSLNVPLNPKTKNPIASSY